MTAAIHRADLALAVFVMAVFLLGAAAAAPAAPTTPAATAAAQPMATPDAGHASHSPLKP